LTYAENVPAIILQKCYPGLNQAIWSLARGMQLHASQALGFQSEARGS